MTDHLRAQGVQQIASCNGSADRLFDALDEEIVDLLVYDFDLLGDSFVDVMQSVRRKVRGRNPFVIILATARVSAVDTVRRLVNAGVDDMLRKPVTNERLFESVSKFMHRRKPFTVSYDYVGPSVATEHRPQHSSEGPVIRVPNTMRSRAVEGVSEAEIQHLVETAVANLQEKQLVACGAEINFQAKQAVSAYEAARNNPAEIEKMRIVLQRMEQVADDLRQRCRGTQFERIGDLATMVVALTQRLQRVTTFRTAVDVQLVVKLAEAIRSALATERDSVGVMRDIAATIADYTKKQ
jgi:DNA-binding response OmpR family regulator